MSRDAFPDRGSRTRTASAGAARARQRVIDHSGWEGSDFRLKAEATRLRALRFGVAG
jgi:hypothetical protein